MNRKSHGCHDRREGEKKGLNITIGIYEALTDGADAGAKAKDFQRSRISINLKNTKFISKIF